MWQISQTDFSTRPCGSASVHIETTERHGAFDMTSTDIACSGQLLVMEVT